MLVSVIITTYNWPDALARVLASLAVQTDKNFEVIIADDGSGAKTQGLINQLKPNLPFYLNHVWQPDEGFRAGKIRNLAVTKAQGDYLIFLDGDCVPIKSFIAQHKAWALPNMFLAGQRILVSQNFTHYILAKNLNLADNGFLTVLRWRIQKKINRVLPLFRSLRYLFTQTRQTWHGAQTCNLGVWREDFININGFDEAFEGWGYEDADLAVRLMHADVGRAPGRFVAPVWHLWHKENDRSHSQENFDRLQAVIHNPDSKAVSGYDQYAA